MKKINKKEFDGDQLLFFKTTKARIVFTEAQDWTLDGEYGGKQKDIRFSVINKAIDICSPENPLFVGDKKEEAIK